MTKLISWLLFCILLQEFWLSSWSLLCLCLLVCEYRVDVPLVLLSVCQYLVVYLSWQRVECWYIGSDSPDCVCSSVVFAFPSSVTTFRTYTMVTPYIVTHLVIVCVYVELHHSTCLRPAGWWAQTQQTANVQWRQHCGMGECDLHMMTTSTFFLGDTPVRPPWIIIVIYCLFVWLKLIFTGSKYPQNV